ncbi:hypothetical protein BHE74_00045474 [Ensete ventricosum]|nr:hypothetical protein BHE74_00045474 [Ensete ventricosum]
MEASEPSGVAAGAGKPTRIETGERSRDPELDGLDLATGSAMTTSGSGIASPWEGIPIRKKLLGFFCSPLAKLRLPFYSSLSSLSFFLSLSSNY